MRSYTQVHCMVGTEIQCRKLNLVSNIYYVEGMTVKKHETYISKNSSSIARHEMFWYLYLIYYDGGVLSYKISRTPHTLPRRLASIWI
jgi:hypothetical protein